MKSLPKESMHSEAAFSLLQWAKHGDEWTFERTRPSAKEEDSEARTSEEEDKAKEDDAKKNGAVIETSNARSRELRKMANLCPWLAPFWTISISPPLLQTPP